MRYHVPANSIRRILQRIPNVVPRPPKLAVRDMGFDSLQLVLHPPAQIIRDVRNRGDHALKTADNFRRPARHVGGHRLQLFADSWRSRFDRRFGEQLGQDVG